MRKACHIVGQPRQLHERGLPSFHFVLRFHGYGEIPSNFGHFHGPPSRPNIQYERFLLSKQSPDTIRPCRDMLEGEQPLKQLQHPCGPLSLPSCLPLLRPRL